MVRVRSRGKTVRFSMNHEPRLQQGYHCTAGIGSAGFFATAFRAPPLPRPNISCFAFVTLALHPFSRRGDGRITAFQGQGLGWDASARGQLALGRLAES